METEKENSETTNKRAMQLTILGVVLVLLFTVVVSFLTDFSLFKTKETVVEPEVEVSDNLPVVEESELVISKTEIKVNRGGQITNLTLNYKDQDVTEQAFWYSDDPSVAYVDNLESIKGQVSPRGVGSTTIRAVYKDLFAESAVSVAQPGLEVDCRMIPKEAKVGEVVEMTAYYTQLGVPFYSYKWTGDDGLDDDTAVITKTYTTPGLKKIHFETYDTEASFAEMDCEILIK